MNNKKTYIIWFIVLITPAIISKIFYYLDYSLLNIDEANITQQRILGLRKISKLFLRPQF